jgi:beta-mannan synthase
MSALVATDRFFHCYIALYWRRFARKSALNRFNHVSLDGKSEDAFPTVVVQLPMFNETDVCQHVIEKVKEIRWPRSKLLIQILDDSTCEETRAAIQESIASCREQGVSVAYRWRSNRTGYKAGAMFEAMDDIVDYDYVCVFDADFSPEPDFLYLTIPWIHSNPQVGFVQARWVFANEGENLLTRVQTISLNYHIRCEQFARFSAGLFFNFNGTAGVWRRTCIIDAGGWNHRTTVEDLDLSLRAHLRGWKFIFLDDVTCLNEIPAQYDAFRKQQHRWSAGPMQLWRKAMSAVWTSDIGLARKLYLNVFFFGTRMFATHLVSFFFYCFLIPLCALCPEVNIPFWALVYAPVLVTLSTVAFTKHGWLFAVPYVLFENAMTIVKLNAMLSGLLELEGSHEWVVTAKLGKWVASRVEKAKNNRIIKRIAQKAKTRARPLHIKELFMAAFFLLCGVYGILVHALVGYSIFLLSQAVVFTLFGLNTVDGLFASSS